jgi:3-methyl-2-oxobutanoate hydroxymethyltransferase
MTVTTQDVRGWKGRGRRFAMLTAYDYPTARVLDEVGIPVLLVGDSLAQNVLGYDTTLPVTMEEMLHHTRAVTRATRNALVVADMPFGSYQASIEDGIRNAGRFLKEAGAGAVKLEGAQVELTLALTHAGIPVMGHLGLTPQSVHEMGGYRVQGRSVEAARRLVDDAHAIEKAGAFAIVLEGLPAALGADITDAVGVPTIGIGAGSGCDGQVLVLTDLLGLSEGRTPTFAKAYADVRGQIAHAARAFARDVESGAFPDDEHSYR